MRDCCEELSLNQGAIRFTSRPEMFMAEPEYENSLKETRFVLVRSSSNPCFESAGDSL